MPRQRILISCLLLSLSLLEQARGDWLSGGWQFRRELDVNWDSGRAYGGELATADFYTAGHDAGGGDIRITDSAGNVVPSDLLRAGPGDSVEVAFALKPGETKYFAYFSNPTPPPPSAQAISYRCGLLMEMKDWTFTHHQPTTAAEVVEQWGEAGPVLARAMIDEPFYQDDPLSDQAKRMFKISGAIRITGEGDYVISGGAEGVAALCVDGAPVLYARGAPRDGHYRVTLHLRQGFHDFTIYYIRPINKGELAFSWIPPGQTRLRVIPKSQFGVLSHARQGALEEFNKPLTADFDADYQGDCPVGDSGDSHRYLFTARAPAGAATPRFDWDFGDGIVAGGQTVEHVYAAKGVYPIRLTVHAGDQSDTQTTRLAVDRLRVDEPPQDPPLKQGLILARYDMSHYAEPLLANAVLIERDAQLSDAEMAAATQMVKLDRHANPAACTAVLALLTDDLRQAGKAQQAVDLLDNASAASDLQPGAAALETDTLIWWVADFPRALKVAQRVADSTDPAGRQAYAQAMVLNGHAADAARIFDDLQSEQEKAGVRLAAVSGAMARTLEYRVDDKDWQNGEDEWEDWQTRCPSAFMEGYSVLLRTELMEERGAIKEAAAIDEAFAAAMPDSAYAPQLLYRGSKILATADPAKSQELRSKLKSLYPEDPLSKN